VHLRALNRWQPGAVSEAVELLDTKQAMLEAAAQVELPTGKNAP